MEKNFATWLQKRDKQLAEAIRNEGFGDWFRRRPALSKAVQGAVLAGGLQHGVEAMPHFPHHEPETPGHGAPISPPERPGEEENHRQHARDDLGGHYVAENLRKTLKQLIFKNKNHPRDPKLMKWLNSLLRKIPDAIHAGLDRLRLHSVDDLVDAMKSLPANTIKAFERMVTFGYDRVKHYFSEMPEGEPDTDMDDAMSAVDRDQGMTQAPSSPIRQSNDRFSGTPRMDRSQYRHRKQDRRGF